jgi:hypothetical protein
MDLNQMLNARQQLNADIVNCLAEEVSQIRALADHMSECATNIKGQGYSTFVQARDDFMSKIDKFQEQLEITHV